MKNNLNTSEAGDMLQATYDDRYVVYVCKSGGITLSLSYQRHTITQKFQL